MKWERIQENWNVANTEVLDYWAKLTDADVAEIGGDRDRLIDKLRQRYDIDAREADRQVCEFAAQF